MRIYKVIIGALAPLTTVLLFAPGQAAAQGTSASAAPSATVRADDDDFTFIQMADTQFGFFSTPLWLAFLGYNGWRPNDFERETDLYARAIAAANQMKPAFVVVCGWDYIFAVDGWASL